MGVNGGDVVVDADEHDFFGAVFSSDVEFAHVAGPAKGYFSVVVDFVSP
ncbi:hypothetical protein QPX23_10640 [Corynebacterium pseudodiphtheriticum]|uniref:Uncharacterized protein n=1 Tax=Corynebacterium pseudodiphtheriticum TaxID=37637 RepID=A0ABT7FYT2_9CORY|nr:hypothetical protein [Corynebacterium pseudodiphtheriticum]MDK4291159.1 hypothetical protein [Corynebacterium pseudodiphtheriticum]